MCVYIYRYLYIRVSILFTFLNVKRQHGGHMQFLSMGFCDDVEDRRV